MPADLFVTGEARWLWVREYKDKKSSLESARRRTSPTSFRVVRKDDYCKRASHLILAEVEEVHALDADLDPDNHSAHALRFSHMLAGFVDRDAVGGGKEGRCEKDCDEPQSVTCEVLAPNIA